MQREREGRRCHLGAVGISSGIFSGQRRFGRQADRQTDGVSRDVWEVVGAPNSLSENAVLPPLLSPLLPPLLPPPPTLTASWTRGYWLHGLGVQATVRLHPACCLRPPPRHWLGQLDHATAPRSALP